jgi:hypothetical protein
MISNHEEDYWILVPMMVANMPSFVISRRRQPVPSDHAQLHQRQKRRACLIVSRASAKVEWRE